MRKQIPGSNKLVSLVLGLVAGGIVGLMLHHSEWDILACSAAAIAVLCAFWWIFEPIPIAATSLVPLALFPLLGIVPRSVVAEQFGSKIVLLLMGGFMLSVALERCGLHLRLARVMYDLFGKNSDKGLVLAIMVTVALMSMWISNTAVVLMFFPVVMALIEKAGREQLAVPLLLGLAYASNVGGLGTPVGTTPNLIFMDQYEKATGIELSFFDWMCIGLPVVFVMVPIIWLWLTRSLAGRSDIDLPPTSAWTVAEKRVLMVFGITAFSWITRSNPWGGWSRWLSTDWLSFENAYDCDTALLAVVAMFLIPDGKGESLLDWNSCMKIPWSVLLLVAGGFTIAQGFREMGLSDGVGELLSGVSSWNSVVVIAAISLAVIFLTEMTSNNATTVLLMPILSVAALKAGMDPMNMMVPAVLSVSCAFMLPVATPSNAIVYASNQFTTKTMAREGLVLNLTGVVVVTLLCQVLF